MEKRRGEQKRKRSGDSVYEDFEPQAIPIAPDGGIVPGYAAQMPDSPAPTEETFICLAGPCRFLWQIASPAEPAAGTWADIGVKPMHHLGASCLVHAGLELELSYNQPISDCNRWDPITASEIADRQRRRDTYQIRRKAEVEAEVFEASRETIVDDGDAVEKGSTP